jgi:hypothetical protein
MEQVKALRGNQQSVFQKGMARVQSLRQEANQSQARSGMKTSDWGQGLVQAGQAVGEGLGIGLNMGPAGLETLDMLGRNAGDIGGGLLRTQGQANAAQSASGLAGAMADAQNERAQQSVIAGAENAADQMNLQARQMSANLTGSAIGQKNAFERGAQAIGMSGIEGSDNMTRNLQYGQDRADAGEQLAYDIAGAQTDMLQDSMVQSFDSLSQSKLASMQNAFNGSLQGAGNALTAERARVSQYAYDTQPGVNDYYAALMAAMESPVKLETEDQKRKRLNLE